MVCAVKILLKFKGFWNYLNLAENLILASKFLKQIFAYELQDGFINFKL